MNIHFEITYIFYLPKDYEKMKEFETENDTQSQRGKIHF